MSKRSAQRAEGERSAGPRTTSATKIRVKQVKSQIGYDRRQRATLRGLGLRRLHQVVEVPDTPAVRGMIDKVSHLVVVEER
jgi:large subunit ribosomal protein L30